MIILADENVDAPVVERLRRDGHEVDFVAEWGAGLSDELVLETANSGQKILLTGDKDFGELVFRRGDAHQGVILLRLSGLTAQAKANIVSGALKRHDSALAGAFTVITPSLLRIRTR